MTAPSLMRPQPQPTAIGSENARLSQSSAPNASYAPSADAAERAAFYQLLWGDTPGYVEILAGLNCAEILAHGWSLHENEINDPDHIGLLIWTRASFDQDKAEGRRHTRRVFEWPAEAGKLDAHAQRMERAYGNVYVSLSVYPSIEDAKKRKNAQPSRVLLVEDAPPDPTLPYSFVVETSPYSRHGYYQLTETMKPAQLVTLARGAADRLHADPGGIDREQIVRLPSSRNTKGKAGNHRVTLHTTGRTYTAADLARDFLPGGLPAVASGERKPRARAERTNAGDVPDVVTSLWDAEKEKRLTLVYKQAQRMLIPEGKPRVVAADKNRSNQGYRIFFDDEFIASFTHTESGSWDASRVRHWRVKALIGRGLTDEQAAAVTFKCEDPETIRRKGALSVWNDTKGRVDYWRGELGVQPSEYSLRLQAAMLGTAQTAEPLPTTPRESRRRGRPECKGGPLAYLAWLREQADSTTGEINKSARECARAYGHCLRTIRTYEKKLQADGEIVRECTDPQRQHSRVVVRSAINQAAEVKTAVDHVVIDDPGSPQQDAENKPAPSLGDTHPAALTAPPQPEPLRAPRRGASPFELVTWARALVAERPIRGKHSQKAMAWEVVHAERPDLERKKFNSTWAQVLEAERDQAVLATITDPEQMRALWRDRTTLADAQRKAERKLGDRALLAERNGDTAKAEKLRRRQQRENARAWQCTSAAQRAEQALRALTGTTQALDFGPAGHAGAAELRDVRELRERASLPNGWERYPTDAPGYMRAKRLKDGALTPLCRKFGDLLWEIGRITGGAMVQAWAGAPPAATTGDRRAAAIEPPAAAIEPPAAAVEPPTFGQAGAERRAALFASLRSLKEPTIAAPAAACE